MTCKGCFHCEICLDTREQMQMLAYLSRNDVEKACEHFKDKSKIVEFPCITLEKNYSGVSFFVVYVRNEYGGIDSEIFYNEETARSFFEFVKTEEAEKALEEYNDQLR